MWRQAIHLKHTLMTTFDLGLCIDMLFVDRGMIRHDHSQDPLGQLKVGLHILL